ncbi:MAG: CBS domain-containing protein [Actinobacteria bacterium]|nr:CBS domain-containing protein [Actinomycetota bacterium]
MTRSGAELATFVVTPGDSLDEALDRLRSNHTGVAVVTGDDERIVGTITDADIRRAMLLKRSNTVADIMSRNPVTAAPDADDARLLDLMTLHRVRAVPIVEHGRLVDMRTLDNVVEEEILPVTVIMAGGQGVRLRPITERVPKPLVEVGEKPIIELVIAPLVEAGIRELTLAVNYKAEMIEESLGDGSSLGVKLNYMREEKRMGTAGALSLLPQEPDRPICVANADIITTLDFARLFDYHWHHRAAITVAATSFVSTIPYGVLGTAAHYLVHVEEKPEETALVSGGVYVLDPEVLRFIKGRAPLDMPDLVADVLAEGLPVCVFPILEKWYDVGRHEDLERARDEFGD